MRDSSGTIVNDVPMLIDSGSDVSLIPNGAADKLDLEIGSGYELEAFDGSRKMAQTIQADLIFLGRAFRGKYVIVDSNMGILGRDVLNHITLLLDGPQLTWQDWGQLSK
jgi:hypothetical protein